MRVAAPDARVEALARETLSQIADVLSFASGGRATPSLGTFTNAPPGITTGDYRTIMPLTRVQGPSGPVAVDPHFVGTVASRIGDIDGERGRRLTRALRWLRRSFTAPDEFGEFTALAFSYESLTSLLLDPPAQGPRHGRGAKRSKVEKADSGEKLRHWALSGAHITPEDWTRVGRLRHGLFHGGLSEDEATRATTLQSIPLLRLAVTTALKHLLGLPPDGPPATTVPPGVVVKVQLTTQGVVQTKPPDTEADEA